MFITVGTFTFTGISVILRKLLDGLWEMISGNDTSYTDIDKPETTYTKQDKPTTIWTKILKP
jgi:hypothetical protein